VGGLDLSIGGPWFVERHAWIGPVGARCLSRRGPRSPTWGRPIRRRGDREAPRGGWRSAERCVPIPRVVGHEVWRGGSRSVRWGIPMCPTGACGPSTSAPGSPERAGGIPRTGDGAWTNRGSRYVGPQVAIPRLHPCAPPPDRSGRLLCRAWAVHPSGRSPPAGDRRHHGRPMGGAPVGDRACPGDRPWHPVGGTGGDRLGMRAVAPGDRDPPTGLARGPDGQVVMGRRCAAWVIADDRMSARPLTQVHPEMGRFGPTRGGKDVTGRTVSSARNPPGGAANWGM